MQELFKPLIARRVKYITENEFDFLSFGIKVFTVFLISNHYVSLEIFLIRSLSVTIFL